MTLAEYTALDKPDEPASYGEVLLFLEIMTTDPTVTKTHQAKARRILESLAGQRASLRLRAKAELERRHRARASKTPIECPKAEDLPASFWRDPAKPN